MKFAKSIQAVIGMATALLFLCVTFPSQATEIKFLKVKYGKSQEQMGEAVKDAAWLRWNKGKIQEETGRFIQDGAQAGKISQEALGSGIAATAHLDWALMEKQAQLGAAIVKITDIANKEAAITGPERIQERLGAVIASGALKAWDIDQRVRLSDRIDAGIRQEKAGRDIQNQAQVNWTTGMMAQVAYASLEGDRNQSISKSMIALLRKNKAFEDERNFRLALTLIENETKQPLSQLFPGVSNAGEGSSVQFTKGGLGGFAEYGAFSLLAFFYVGWVFSWVVKHLEYYREPEEEIPWEFPKAA